MKFNPTKLAGVTEVLLEPKADERGFFARTWCQKEFEANGLNPRLVQCNLSVNPRKGTLRGMHYQAEPHAEGKLVQCTRGEIYDVALDLRNGSTTYKKWIGKVLSAEQHNMLYVPEGCAHGFLTLSDESEVFYQMSEFYEPRVRTGNTLERSCLSDRLARSSSSDLRA